ncbi:Asp/Glu/hydantoin racemase [Janthinobacterium sp. TB1-E2]|uniref:Asp/Glu/hydantoin racemase n=1 Tax=Janthinobacterium aestuarii TaxID=2985511 RepID=A0ABZ2GT72_9BURK
MTSFISFLHTSPVHVASFARLLDTQAPGMVAEHHVDEALLAAAQQAGADEAALERRIHAAMAAAAANGAAVVVCTCSTIGAAAEHTPTGGRYTAMRIDRAMADAAVLAGPCILVVAALASTLAPTTRLLQESAAALDRPIQLQSLLAEGAWTHFQAGDHATYIGAITGCIMTATPAADVIVLAQASMAPAAQALQELGVPVLSSPSLGVARALAQLQAP